MIQSFRRPIAAVPVFLIIAGCAISHGPLPLLAEELSSDVYHLRAGDDLEISVWGHSDLTRKVQIREDGTFSFSFIGNIPAAGRSVNELEKVILEKLNQATAPPTNQEPTERTASTRRVLSPTEIPNEVYRLKPGDELDISVWGHDDLSRKVPVREEGFFSFPLIGNVDAVNRSLQEIEKEVQERLDKDYIVNPQVTVGLSGAKFSVLGEVEHPGSYALEGSMDLLKAISEAGGMTKSGSNRGEIIRDTENSKFTIRVDLERILQGKDPTVSIVPRDTIYVMGHTSEELQVTIRLIGAKFSVLGEVERPGSYPIEGSMDVLTAISEAGGMTKFGSNRVEIIRSRGDKKVTVRLNLDRILQGKDPNAQILPRDTVYVKRRLF